MSEKERKLQEGDPETDQIMEGLSGKDYQLGVKYYCFTITYHYIGTLVKLTNDTLTLDNAMIVLSAGDADNAVSSILAGKTKPKVFEEPGRPIVVSRRAITVMIPFPSKK
jgi:hypothetical protein